MSDKSWEPGSFLMFSYVFQCFLTFSNVTYSHSHSHSLSLSLFLYAQKSLFILDMLNTLSHSHTLSISHSITLDMLNKFCFHLYAQKSLFIGENCNGFFLRHHQHPHLLLQMSQSWFPAKNLIEFQYIVPTNENNEGRVCLQEARQLCFGGNPEIRL